jgi:hypothetical protein
MLHIRQKAVLGTERRSRQLRGKLRPKLNKAGQDSFAWRRSEVYHHISINQEKVGITRKRFILSRIF